MVNGNRYILIADDEPKMVRAIKDFLEANNFKVIDSYDGESALDTFYKYNSEIDLILLDVMMPKLDGFKVLADLRENNILTPVIMITARGEEYDQLKGFKNGADDYVTKPFSPSLLLARIESVLKRVGKSTQNEVVKGDININVATRKVSVCGNDLELTKREFDLLLFFLTNTEITFTREQLLNNVWGYDFEGDIRTVDTHIKQLRTKFRDSTCHIRTIHRIGYKFEVNDESIDKK